jgi:signal transduction histidine kinase
MRNWRISTRLVSLLALPVVAATSLGALRIQSSLDNFDQLGNMKSLTDITESSTELAASLQNERDVAAGPLSSKPREDKNDAVVAAREQTTRAKQAFDSVSGNVPGNLTGVRSTVLAINRQLSKLTSIRDNAYTNADFISQTVNDYDGLIQSLLALSQDMAQATNNPDMIAQTRTLAAFSSAKEFDSIQRAVISAALADNRQLATNDWQYLQSSASSETSALQQFKQIYGTGADALLKGITGGNDTINTVNDEQARIAASETGIRSQGGSYRDWDDNAQVKIDEMTRIEQSLLKDMQQKALQLRTEAQQQALLDGALILLVLGISVVGAFVVARSMIRSLRRLQDTAQEVAQKRLPELVRHLSESDPQDVDTSVESIGIHSRDEIGQVARAFDEVHREAVRLATQQALLRGNVNAMFTNLSRRSQGLIQRQLSLISELESREADPDQLSSLFKLDHLATRMRRNGENLLVLAGEEPGRRWTRPVPLVDVLRAAASEVEQYERIELTSVPAAEVTGRVVNDLVHLLAELLENATSFSSPQTKVRVTGHALPDGRVLIEIHDTGIGLSPEDLADINERLANPPTVDVSVSRRMGLFVVGRLSLRHGIRIQLRPSDSGGTTALVMLPVDVTQGGKPRPGAPGAGQQSGAAIGPMGTTGAGAGGAGPLGRQPQRNQVPAAEQRPALNPSGPADAGAPPNGRPGGPAWAQDQEQGNQGRGHRRGGSRGQQPKRGQNAPQPVSADRGPMQDTARGHEDVEATAALPRMDFDAPPAGAFPPAGTFPPAGNFPHTGPQHESAGQFPRPTPLDWQQRPADPESTGQMPRADFNASAPGAIPHTGPQRGPGNPESTGQFPRSTPAGRDQRPAGPGPTGQSPRADFNAPAPGARTFPPSGAGQRPQPDTGQVGRPFTRSDVFQPPADRRPGTPARPGGPQAPGNGNLPAPRQGSGAPGNGLPEQYPPGTGRGNPQRPAQQPGGPGGTDFAPGRDQGGDRRPLPPAAEPMALPPAPVRDDERSPIFEALESDWFRTGQAERMQQVHVESGPVGPTRQAPAAPNGQNGHNGHNGQGAYNGQGGGYNGQSGQPVGRPAGPQRTRAAHSAPAPTPSPVPSAQSAQHQPTQPPRREPSSWRPTPNDEVWRQAEQVREPSAGGITPSGLPRRVPRANLVPGGAAPQQAPQGGPQVSRAPDDVRGRLTNLRRGIQQGRQAGTGGPTHQQER